MSLGGDGGGNVTEVVYRLEPHAGGTRFSYEHAGFTGVGGVLMAKLLGRVWTKMLKVGLPAVLDDLDDDGNLRPASTPGGPSRPSPPGVLAEPSPRATVAQPAAR